MKPVQYHQGRFPPEDQLDWQRLLPLIGPATSALARYDGMLASMPNRSVLLAPLSTREAVLSSRIEGIQATMSEVLGFEAGDRAASPQRLSDIHEIINFRRAVRLAQEMLEDLPLSGRVIRAAHETHCSRESGETTKVQASTGVSRTGLALRDARSRKPSTFPSDRKGLMTP